jgi:hypothetical protein
MTGAAMPRPYTPATSWHPAQWARPLRGETTNHATTAQDRIDRLPTGSRTGGTWWASRPICGARRISAGPSGRRGTSTR